MSATGSSWDGVPAMQFPVLTDAERTARLEKLAEERKKIGNPARRAFGREDFE